MTSTRKIRIATRESQLALWQANHVADSLTDKHADLEVELVGMTTKGDQILNSPLAKIGGKGLFVKELEKSMLDGNTDIAVHSMKDVPVEFPEGLHLNIILKREDPRDAFVSNKFASFDELPQGAVVGTSSLRRQCQIRARRPDLQIRDLRGNVNTRLAKLDNDEYDAIILASAGLKRLEFHERIRAYLEPEISLPAIGQGAIGIESRINDQDIGSLLQVLHDDDTAVCVLAERAMNETLQGGCQVPIAGYAVLQGDEIWMRGLVGSTDGSKMLYAEARAARDQYQQLGIQIAEDLLQQGAGEILKAL